MKIETDTWISNLTNWFTFEIRHIACINISIIIIWEQVVLNPIQERAQSIQNKNVIFL